MDVCVSTVLHRRERAGSLITKKSATLQGCPMDYQRTTGPADTVLALKDSLVPEKTLQITARSRLPGYLKDLCTVKWLLVSSPMNCRATSSRETNTTRQ